MAINKVNYGNTTLIDLTDTTATASDVASGKYFYSKDGVKTLGTNAGGGGASNVRQGTFTTGERNTRGSISTGYTGNGYPVAVMVVIKGGSYNDTAEGNTDWYNSVDRYDIGNFWITKARMTSIPDYTSSNANNYGVTAYIYKNSTSTPTNYTRSSAMNTRSYASSALSVGSGATAVVLTAQGKTLAWKVGNLTSSTIGLAPETEYEYVVVYSE